MGVPLAAPIAVGVPLAAPIMRIIDICWLTAPASSVKSDILGLWWWAWAVKNAFLRYYPF